MKVFSRVLFLSLGLLISKPLLAAGLSAAEQLSVQLKPMSSLTAHFEQTISDVDGVQLQKASGLLTVKRPRHFYWRTEQPYEHLVVTDGKTLWLYDIDLEQITRKPFNSDLDKAPALLLSGEIDAINQQYQVVIDSPEVVAEDSMSASVSRYRLTPNKPDALFKELVVEFKSGLLTTMSLRDSFDQLTRIEFSDVILNPLVDDALFDFSPPAGIDVFVDEL